mmetsp:Transcript_32659/g.44854  ORF Transcript_32659/g.44854 Transcript_32659/m.44854 type:complete len:95 (+) Transcript_32659:2947-3231(+)
MDLSIDVLWVPSSDRDENVSSLAHLSLTISEATCLELLISKLSGTCGIEDDLQKESMEESGKQIPVGDALLPTPLAAASPLTATRASPPREEGK